MRMPRFVRRRRMPGLSSVATGLALGIAVGSLVAVGLRVSQAGKRQRHTNAKLDDSLKGTYPASDPPASQFYDIPSNRV